MNIMKYRVKKHMGVIALCCIVLFSSCSVMSGIHLYQTDVDSPDEGINSRVGEDTTLYVYYGLGGEDYRNITWVKRVYGPPFSLDKNIFFDSVYHGRYEIGILREGGKIDSVKLVSVAMTDEYQDTLDFLVYYHTKIFSCDTAVQLHKTWDELTVFKGNQILPWDATVGKFIECPPSRINCVEEFPKDSITKIKIYLDIVKPYGDIMYLNVDFDLLINGILYKRHEQYRRYRWYDVRPTIFGFMSDIRRKDPLFLPRKPKTK